MDDCESPTLVVFADDWGRHPSSCQHLVRRLQPDYRILWANTIGTRLLKANGFTVRRGFEKLNNWRQGVKKVFDTMWVVDLPMLPVGGRIGGAINSRLIGWRLASVLRRLNFQHPIVLTTLPFVSAYIRGIPRSALAYYCTDDFSFWPDADREFMQRSEFEIIGEADVVFGVSKALLARLGERAPCHYLPHGVDVQHFATVGQVPLPEQLTAMPGKRIGFFGLIYEKLDFELLETLADAFPNDSLVMIGPVTHCPASFRQRPNVHFVGPQPYGDLPRWLSALDVLLLPYVKDSMIEQSSPLKLRECLASGKPTVSVDVPEARLLEPHVRVAADYDDFLRHVADALREDDESGRADARRNAVAQDHWEARAAQLKRFLSEAVRK